MSQPEQYYPLFLNMTGQTALVLGGGTVAEAKVRPLLAAGASIRLVANKITYGLAALLENADAEILIGDFIPSHLDNVRLAIDCGDNPLFSTAIRQAAKVQGVLLNCVDADKQADFISPATLTRGPLQVAISTGGAAPIFARNLRQILDVILPVRLGTVLTRISALRKKGKITLPAGKREAFWEGLFQQTQLEILQNCQQMHWMMH